jgi:hypothetical protein
MPELSEAAGYLVALLHSAGTVGSNGMGLVGLTWTEIESWARCNDYVGILSPKEYRAIYSLSRAYAGQYSESSKKDAKPPYVKPVERDVERDEVVREMVTEKVDDVFGAMMKAQKRD